MMKLGSYAGPPFVPTVSARCSTRDRSPGRQGTLLTGYAGRPRRLVADRWDGVRWRRLSVVPTPGRELGPRLPDAAQRPGLTLVAVGGRLLVFAGRRAWLWTP
jgi:hypothetical protein